MKLFYSKKLELTDGDSVIIPINKGLVGDVSTTELWVYSEDGNYEIETTIGENVTNDITKGIDMNNFALADTASEHRMLYIISDATSIKITASGDTTLEVKVLY